MPFINPRAEKLRCPEQHRASGGRASLRRPQEPAPAAGLRWSRGPQLSKYSHPQRHPPNSPPITWLEDRAGRRFNGPDPVHPICNVKASSPVLPTLRSLARIWLACQSQFDLRGLHNSPAFCEYVSESSVSTPRSKSIECESCLTRISRLQRFCNCPHFPGAAPAFAFAPLALGA